MSNTATKQQITLSEYIKDYALFHRWTAETIAAWLKQQPEIAMDQEIPSSFSSIKNTLTHIYFVEKGWLANLQNREEPRHAYGQPYEGPMSELLEKFVENSRTFVSFVRSLTEEELHADCHFKAPVRWPEWDDFSKPRFDVIQHAITHATYHRGQLITMAHNLGFSKAPMTDYMAWLLTARDTYKA